MSLKSTLTLVEDIPFELRTVFPSMFTSLKLLSVSSELIIKLALAGLGYTDTLFNPS